MCPTCRPHRPQPTLAFWLMQTSWILNEIGSWWISNMLSCFRAIEIQWNSSTVEIKPYIPLQPGDWETEEKWLPHGKAAAEWKEPQDERGKVSPWLLCISAVLWCSGKQIGSVQSLHRLFACGTSGRRSEPRVNQLALPWSNFPRELQPYQLKSCSSVCF